MPFTIFIETERDFSMKIQAIYSHHNITPLVKKDKKAENSQPVTTNKTELYPQFNDWLISFGARVDKGLNRFYNENKDRMPKAVRELVEPMPNRGLLTPMEAQYYAYEKLEAADNVADIKEAYPNEPLFKDLKDPSEKTKSTVGILHAIREMNDLYEDGVLQTKENLTVYLVKKIFLEAKTIDEINKDLENDLDTDFKTYYNGKNPDSPYIRNSTLSALGIQIPDKDYLQSLRYTRDGYSDMMGSKIKKGLNDFYNSLTPEQRTARNAAKVMRFERWWNRLTLNEKMDLIADKEYQLEMLKAYKKEERAEKKRLKEAGIDLSQTEEIEKRPRTKSGSGSSSLSQDELFKSWATLNLKIFEAGLSQADKDSLHLKRMVRQVNRWKEMSAEERTDYISKMKAGAEPLRFSMIEAWNNSPEIIKALYIHLKSNQIYKPADLLYSSDEFSQFQSRVMTEFWANNPEFAQKLGDRIREAQIKVETAIQRGTFDELKNQINRNKNDRKKELEAYRKSLEKPVETPQVQTSPADYKDDFRQAYSHHIFGMVNSVPKNYFSDVYESFLNKLPEDIVKLWTRNLRGEELTQEEIQQVSEALSEENNPECIKFNRAFEAAMADALYTATNNPEVFELSNSDVKMVMYHVERGETPIKIISHKNNKEYIFNINKHKHIDTNRINQVYESYKRDLSSDEIVEIFRYNFGFKNLNQNKSEEQEKQIKALNLALIDYLETYGRSINILFSDKSSYPAEVKAKFAHKFLANMPETLKNNNIIYCYFQNDRSFEIDTKMKQAEVLFGRRFLFLPKDLVHNYFKEFKTMLFGFDTSINFPLDKFIKQACQKRDSIKSHGTIAPIPKAPIKDRFTKYQMLAVEQAMADVLFEASGQEDVYKIGFEQLCDKLELFSMAKSFPIEPSECKTVDNGSFMIIMSKRPKLSDVQKKYKEYMEEISEWVDKTEDVHKPDYQDLLYILNPEDNNYKRDFNTGERMATYFGDLGSLEFTLHPNDD